MIEISKAIKDIVDDVVENGLQLDGRTFLENMHAKDFFDMTTHFFKRLVLEAKSIQEIYELKIEYLNQLYKDYLNEVYAIENHVFKKSKLWKNQK